jgi:large subunit ribosomal protein L10
MAISRDKKQSLVSELGELLGNAKMTAFAAYEGLTVADIQKLRRAAREQNVTIKVVKNRLVRVALEQSEALKTVDTSTLKGQLLYAVSSEDEVAPAQTLANFAKTHEALKLQGGISAEGNLLSETEVKALATLPSKNELIAQVLATLSSPLDGVMNGLSGNLHALLDGVEAKATA